jgi:uncharacterized protein (DUF2252 family)
VNIVDATRSYEEWLQRQTAVVADDLARKHDRMREGPFVFLRATFYRWLQHWPAECRSEATAPEVLAVGDLHTENFGTWRDAEGRLVWGVNDVDEACRAPYTLDLVRLATSVMFAARERFLRISDKNACHAILEGYQRCLLEGGRPVILAEHQAWLRDLALVQLRDPAEFWRKLRALKRATRGVPHDVFRSSLPDRRLPYVVVRRVAGVGSLGRRRLVALADWGGALIAREAKAFAPPAAAWAWKRSPTMDEARRLLRAAERVEDPYFSIRERWVVRRLAPDCARVELADLPRKRDEKNLLRAMGWETGNLHLASGARRILNDLHRRPHSWLQRAAGAMASAIYTDWRHWKRSA